MSWELSRKVTGAFDDEIASLIERIMRADDFDDLEDADKELILRAELAIIDAGGNFEFRYNDPPFIAVSSHIYIRKSM